MKVSLRKNDLAMWFVCEAIGEEFNKNFEINNNSKASDEEKEDLIKEINFIVNGVELNFENVIKRINELVDEMVEDRARKIVSEKCEELVKQLTDEALNALDVFPENEAIKEYANYLADREY